MSYVALYRTWRPQDFDALVGQDHIKTALTNALESGRIAHAYLFTGPRGTGKTSTARILAKALNCEKGPTAHPCNACANCKQITEGSSMDVIEIDAASNRGIDEIRQLRERVAFAPANSRYKVYIIDEVHMITTDAFNALLKTLEEPPEHVVFILATTEPQKIPATIHSRCQRYDFRRVTIEDITQHLAKVAAGSGIEADTEALRLMAIQADGGMRDAVSLLDQCGVMEKHVTAETVRKVLGIVGSQALRNLVTLIGKGDLSGALEAMNELSAQGKDIKQIILEITEYLRALLLFKADAKYEDIYLTDTKEAFTAIAPLYTTERILAATERLHKAIEEMRLSARSKIMAELCLFDLCHIRGDSLAALSARIAQLEAKLAKLGGQKLFGSVDSLTLPPQQASVTKTAGGKAMPVTPGQSVQLSAKAPEPSEEFTLEEETKILGRMDTKPPKAAVPAPQSLPDKPVDTAQGQELWRKVCQALAKKRKRTILAYAEMGQVKGLSGSMLTVGLHSQTSKERLEQEDFKSIIESILAELMQKSIAAHFVVDAEQNASTIVQVQKANKPKAAVKIDKKELPPTVKSALNVFGGTVKKE